MSNDNFGEYDFDDSEIGEGAETNGNGATSTFQGPDGKSYTITAIDATMALVSAIENLTDTLHRLLPQSAPPVPVEEPEAKEEPKKAEG